MVFGPDSPNSSFRLESVEWHSNSRSRCTVAVRVVLALSPLGSYIQDDNQLSSPLTSYDRCKHFPTAYLIFQLTCMLYYYICQPGGYLSIPPRNRPILGQIIQTCTHAVRLRQPHAYSSELMFHTVATRLVPFLNYRPHVADTSNAPVDII